MDRLRQALLQIQSQLGVLTRSQRIAIALCAVLVAVSLLWLMRWSTAPELVPLLTQRVEDLEELSAIREQLRGRTYKISGNQVFVKPDEKSEIMLDLSTARVLPSGNTWDLNIAATTSDPFVSPEQRQFQHNVALGNTLAATIMESDDVHKAFVKVSPQTHRRIGRSNDVPTAAVRIHMASGKSITREMVAGWAEFIAGAVPGLKAHNVTIQDGDTNRAYHVPRPEDALNSQHLAHAKEEEDRLADKILEQLKVPGATVAVSIELDTDRTTTKKITLGKPQPEQELRDETTSGSNQPPAESGVRANTGVALTAGGGGVSSSTQKEETRFYPPTVEQEEFTTQAGFSIERATASVSLPRSFLAALFTSKNPEAGEPTDEDLEADRTEQLDRVRRIASTILRTDSPSDVNVDVYPDMNWTPDGASWNSAPGAATVVTTVADGGGAMAAVTRYGPQGFLACLAAVSLFMMMRIVRKSAAHMPPLAPDAPGDREDEDEEELDEVLTAGAAPVGQAQRGDTYLTAKELDAETLQDLQLTSEVAQMVEDNPETAAELLKTWVEESD